MGKNKISISRDDGSGFVISIDITINKRMLKHCSDKELKSLLESGIKHEEYEICDLIQNEINNRKL